MNAKTKTILKITAAIVLPTVVAIGGYYLIYKPYKKRKDEEDAKKEAEEAAKTGAITTPSGGTTPITNDGFPLKLGSRGNNVKRLQDILVKKGWAYDFAKNGGYGTFGKKTLEQVQKYFKKDTVTENDLIATVTKAPASTRNF